MGSIPENSRKDWSGRGAGKEAQYSWALNPLRQGYVSDLGTPKLRHTSQSLSNGLLNE